MGEAGILREDDRVELIDGEIVQMTPIGSAHAACVKRLMHLFVRALADRAIVSVQDPIAIPRGSEPQPDLALLRPRADFYRGGHPQPADVWLVVEVADSSLAYDRAVKLPLYARAGIPEVWLVDLSGDTVEVLRRPAAGRYGETQRRQRSERLGCEAFPDTAFSVDDVLGPRS